MSIHNLFLCITVLTVTTALLATVPQKGADSEVKLPEMSESFIAQLLIQKKQEFYENAENYRMKTSLPIRATLGAAFDQCIANINPEVRDNPQVREKQCGSHAENINNFDRLMEMLKICSSHIAFNNAKTSTPVSNPL